MHTIVPYGTDKVHWSSSRIALGIRRRRSQRKNTSARSFSMRRRAIPDARSSVLEQLEHRALESAIPDARSSVPELLAHSGVFKRWSVRSQ